MVHCVKCGTENADNAKFCVKCGAELYVTSGSEQYRRVENECFGLPHGGLIVGLVIGIIVLLFGIAAILNIYYPNINYSGWVFAIFIIVIGLLIIGGALYRMQKRRY